MDVFPVRKILITIPEYSTYLLALLQLSLWLIPLSCHKEKTVYKLKFQTVWQSRFDLQHTDRAEIKQRREYIDYHSEPGHDIFKPVRYSSALQYDVMLSGMYLETTINTPGFEPAKYRLHFFTHSSATVKEAVKVCMLPGRDCRLVGASRKFQEHTLDFLLKKKSRSF